MAEEGGDQTPKHEDPSSEQFTGKEDVLPKMDAESSETLTVHSAGEVTDLERLKSITTMNVVPSGQTFEAEPALVPDTIAFHLPGKEEPLIFYEQDEITLGRSGASNISLPDVDLNIDHGVLLGVSRQHAVIRRTNEGYFVEDLDSTNGTWVNGKPLVPYKPYGVHNGDQLVLGEQILFLYFSFGDQEVVHTLLLKDHSQSGMEQAQATLSVPYLLEKAGTYLRALANIQHVLDEALQQPFTVGVDHVGKHINGQWVEIAIRGAGLAIEAIRTTIEELPDSFDPESPEPATADVRDGSEAYPFEYRAAAQRIVKTVVPDLTGDRLYEWAGMLLPHMVTIVQSDFEIVSCRVKLG